MKIAIRCVSFLVHFGLIIRMRKSRNLCSERGFPLQNIPNFVFQSISSGNLSKRVCESQTCKRKFIILKKMITMIPGNLYIKTLVPNYPDSLTSQQ